MTRRADAVLQISADRIWLYGGALVAIGLCAAFMAHSWQLDWITFRIGGGLAGSPALLEPHNYPVNPFEYPPAVAWFFYPAAHFPEGPGFVLYCVLMLLFCAFAGVVGARVYGLRIPFAVLAILAWVPATQAGFLGQFTPVALVLALFAIAGLTRRNDLLTGVAVGLLLYKPPDAIAFVLLLIVRREWRALTVFIAVAVGWYFASLAATGGDWGWPIHYLTMLHGNYASDFAVTTLKTVSLAGLLAYAGVTPAVATLCGLAVLACAIPRFAKAPILEAASMAPLVGLAASNHAYMYEAVLVIPSLLYVMTHVAEPWRTRLVVAAYTIAPLWVLGPWIKFDPLAIVVLGGAALWLIGGRSRRALVAATPHSML